MVCSSRFLGKAKAYLLVSTLTLAVAAFPGVGHTTGLVTERDSTHTVSFSDTSQFSDASIARSATLQLFGASPATQGLNWDVPHGATGFSVVDNTPLAFSTTAPGFTAGSLNDIYSFAVLAQAMAPTPGSITILDNLGVNVAPAGAVSNLAAGNNGTNYYLDEFFNPAANQSVGANFFLTESLPGNYSTIGTAQGDHKLLNINPAWTITSNFVFNGTDTIFSAYADNYALADQIDLEYQIYGATVVPEPSTLSMLGLGLVAACLLMSHRGSKAGV